MKRHKVVDAACEARSRLFTLREAAIDDGGGRWSFGAVVARGEGSARNALSRAARRDLALADVREGFDRNDPFAAAFVSPDLANQLDRAGRTPTAFASSGWSVWIEQCFRP